MPSTPDATSVRTPQPIAGLTMLGVAFAGLCANVGVYLVLRDRSSGNLNVAAARLHVLGDLLGSVLGGGRTGGGRANVSFTR